MPTFRTTPALVKGIISVEEGFDITPFITTANMLTTKLCTYVAPLVPYTDDGPNSQMEIIERWLSAHFYTIYDNQIKFAKAGSAAVEFMQKIDYGLMNSMYGQQAMMLDTNGALAKWSNSIKDQRKVKVSIGWLGKRRSCFPAEIWPDLTTET